MVSKINKAGTRPAFPTKGPFEPGLKNSSFAYPGITIRDWFARIGACGDAGHAFCPDTGNFHNNCGEPFIGTAEYAARAITQDGRAGE